MNLEYQKMKEKMLTNLDAGCQHFFAVNGFMLENAYCQLINSNLEEAKKCFKSVEDADSRAKWGLFMISMIENDVKTYPTYFELRNFLEIDLNILIHYFKGYYVENIVRYADFMFTINPEVHKFIGRVLYNNDFLEQAMFFLDRARNYFYNDPELHYLLGFIYFNNKDYEKSQKALNDCLTILPEYFPAIDLTRKINEICAN